jgi:hypothetical protein
MLSRKQDMKNRRNKSKSVLFLSGIMTGLKMLSAINIGISGKRLDMLSIECPD